MAKQDITLPNESGQTDLYRKPTPSSTSGTIRGMGKRGEAIEMTSRGTTARGPARATGVRRSIRSAR